MAALLVLAVACSSDPPDAGEAYLPCAVAPMVESAPTNGGGPTDEVLIRAVPVGYPITAWVQSEGPTFATATVGLGDNPQPVTYTDCGMAADPDPLPTRDYVWTADVIVYPATGETLAFCALVIGYPTEEEFDGETCTHTQEMSFSTWYAWVEPLVGLGPQPAEMVFNNVGKPCNFLDVPGATECPPDENGEYAERSVEVYVQFLFEVVE